MRRDPHLRPENLLAGGLDDIERLREALSKITDGRGLIISPGSGIGSTTPPFETSEHVLYGSKHTRALRVTSGSGLNADYEQGQIWAGGTFYSITAGSLALDDNATNYVYVSLLGVVEYSAVEYPWDCIPLAIVVTSGGSITSVTDRRSYMATGMHEWPPAGTILVEEDDAPVDPQASAIDFVEPDAVLVTISTPGEVEVAMNLYALLAGRSGGQNLIGGLISGENLTLQSNAVLDGLVLVAAGDPLAINDANFLLALVSNNPRITYDANDYVEFDRAGNYFSWVVGSTEALRLNAGYLHLVQGYVQLEDMATPAAPAADDFRYFTRVVGSRIHLIGQSMTGDECIICDLPNVVPPVHVNKLTLNWIE